MTKYLGESCNPGPDADVDDDMAPEVRILTLLHSLLLYCHLLTKTEKRN